MPPGRQYGMRGDQHTVSDREPAARSQHDELADIDVATEAQRLGVIDHDRHPQAHVDSGTLTASEYVALLSPRGSGQEALRAEQACHASFNAHRRTRRLGSSSTRASVTPHRPTAG